MENIFVERSLLNSVPCVITCLRALRAQVLKCQRVMRVCMLMCQRALRALVLTYQRALSAFVPHVSTYVVCLYTHMSTWLGSTRSFANMPGVPCFTWFSLPRYHLPTCFAFSVTSFDATFFSFTVIVAEVVHTVGKVLELIFFTSVT